MMGSVSVPPNAENGALLLLELVKNPAAFEAQIVQFANARAELASAQKQLDETKFEVDRQARDNAATLAQIRDEAAAADGKKKAALAKIELQTTQQFDLENRERALDLASKAHHANVADERAAAAKRTMELDDRQAALDAREQAVAKREAEADKAAADYTSRMAALKAITG